MTTEKQLEAAIQAVEGTLAHHQCVFTNGQGLMARANDARRIFMNRVQATSGDGTPLNIPRGHPEVTNLLSMDASTDYLAADGIAKAVTSSPEYIEAAGLLEPMIAEVRALESQVADEAQAAGIRAAEREAARAAATEKAMAEVEKQFAEPEAMAPAEPAPLIRGRQKLETASV